MKSCVPYGSKTLVNVRNIDRRHFVCLENDMTSQLIIAQVSGHVRSFSDLSVISIDFDIQMQNLHSNFTYVWSSLVLASITGLFGWFCPIFCAFGGLLFHLFLAM